MFLTECDKAHHNLSNTDKQGLQEKKFRVKIFVLEKKEYLKSLTEAFTLRI